MITTGRRSFLAATGLAFSGLLAGAGATRALGGASGQGASPYGPLRPDPDYLLDLPEGFSYRVISRLGNMMDDGEAVPDSGDGMGCFHLPDGKLALVRNHESRVHHSASVALPSGFDRTGEGRVLGGGTTTIVLDARSLDVERQFRSLAGTIRNCAGGVTPWGSWLTCEEDVTRAGDGVGRDHGWVFEVPASATGLVDATPLTAMGRFYHEAAAVDPETGAVYMTEDREDGLLYRFLPNTNGKLAEGGKLQALAVDGLPDSRNWSGTSLARGSSMPVRWVDLDDVESPDDDLRYRGAAKGATVFARGEGIHMGESEAWFCCTSGGEARLGQIFRLGVPAGGNDHLELSYESSSANKFNYGDNLTVGPNGHLIVCEDQGGETVDNHLRGITPAGKPYALARLRTQTELAGACWSPDGKYLFVNAYSPTATIAITGPWVD
jgi:uncharacterized protein